MALNHYQIIGYFKTSVGQLKLKTMSFDQKAQPVMCKLIYKKTHTSYKREHRL